MLNVLIARNLGKDQFLQMRSKWWTAVVFQLTAVNSALHAAQFKEEDWKEQAVTTLEVPATALLSLVHHGVFAQMDSANCKSNKTGAISKVINTFEKVAEGELQENGRSTMPAAGPEFKG